MKAFKDEDDYVTGCIGDPQVAKQLENMDLTRVRYIATHFKVNWGGFSAVLNALDTAVNARSSQQKEVLEVWKVLRDLVYNPDAELCCSSKAERETIARDILPGLCNLQSE